MRSPSAVRCVIESTDRLVPTAPVSNERILTFDDNDRLRELVGELGAHLKLVSRELQVDVVQRGNTLRLAAHNGTSGTALGVAVRLFSDLYTLVEGGHALHASDVATALRVLQADPTADLRALFDDTVVTGVGNKAVSPRTPGQRDYVAAMRSHDIVFGVGPAGTGKTYLAMAMAVAALLKGQVRRIVLTRPAVEAGEKLGFLPGDLAEKVDPYLRPLYDALQDMVPADRVDRMMQKGVVEVAPLAFMRGRTLNDAYILLDEAQNTTTEQMKMFLTRLGNGSRMVISGDDTQIDLQRGRESGLVHALSILRAVDQVAIVRLTAQDIVRHPVVAAVVAAYETDASRRRTPEGRP